MEEAKEETAALLQKMTETEIVQKGRHMLDKEGFARDDFTDNDFTEDNLTEDNPAGGDAAWDDLAPGEAVLYEDGEAGAAEDGCGAAASPAADLPADDWAAEAPAAGRVSMANTAMRKSMGRTVRGTLRCLLLLTVGAVCAFWAYVRFFAEGGMAGEWTASLDMREQAAASAFFWLQDIEQASVSLEEVGASMPELTIQVNLTLRKTSRFGGNFQCDISPESYEACRQAAYEAFAGIFREIVAKRLNMAGYGEGVDAQSVEALAAEAFGMPTASYLMEKGPALLPALEEMQARYGGSGVYEAKDGILTRHFTEGQPDTVRTESYIRQGSSLVLSKAAGSDVREGLFGQHPVFYTKNR